MWNKFLYSIAFFFISLSSFSQGQDKLWLMGYDCCQPLFRGINFNFSSGNLIVDTVQRLMNMNCTNGEICDSNGNLLFYSNGIYIANAMGDTMLNGSGLNPADFTIAHTEYGLTIPQANLIIPFPNDSQKYYLFHETADDRFNTYSSFYLYYSIIDMALDNGNGAVLSKNNVLLNDTLIEGRLTACKHANGRDWWLFSHKYATGLVYEWLITPQGIQGPWTQNLITWRNNFFGQAVFSPDGKKFAYYDPHSDLDIADFDRCTGTFSNFIQVSINDSAAGGGAAFSRSGRFLYISSQNYIYQFDMQASNIPASQTTVGIYNGYASHGFAANFYLAALAPDDKIYINCGNGTTEMHVINNPDSAGLACDFCQDCVLLPAFNAFTIPNFPNYFLGAEGGTVCDSLTTGVPKTIQEQSEISLFPNPVRNLLYVRKDKNEKFKELTIFNLFGQRMEITLSELKSGEYFEINTSSLVPGVYFMEMVTQRERVVRRFVKE